MLYSQDWQLFNVELSKMRTNLLGSGNLLYNLPSVQFILSRYMNLNQIEIIYDIKYRNTIYFLNPFLYPFLNIIIPYLTNIKRVYGDEMAMK